MNSVILIAAVVLLGSTIQADESGTISGSLRVWDVRPDTFDYVFANYSEAVDGDWHLSFNDRGGRTYFVIVGDMLGNYRVFGFEPFEESVHVPELNDLQFRKSGRVVLEAPGGRVHILKQGEWLETGGHRAIVVSGDGGRYWSLREGDRFSDGESAFNVTSVSPEDVVADNRGVPVVIPPVSEDERTQLAEKWKSQAVAQREASMAAAVRVSDDDAGVSHARMATSSRLPATEFHVGREVRIPSEYGVMFVPAGRNGWRPVVFPRKFETYYDGVRWGSYGMVIEQPPYFALPRGSSGARVSFPSIRITVAP